MELDGIYTELIAEHGRSAANRRHLDFPTVKQRGRNPSCGDEISVEVQLENGLIKDASFTGVGCAISQASASLMVDLLRGQTQERAQQLAELFLRMIKGECTDEKELEALEEAAALQNISRMPARVKCAVLAWRTMLEMLAKETG